MTATEAVERALSALDEQEEAVRAWASFDADLALRHAARFDASETHLPLRGLVVGVKDIFDTADFPTEYGSAIYHGNRPQADAAIVTMLRTNGAVCLGKTVTAEFAMFTPGPTTNPHRHTHTPGGSSSGSAAAVAAGMADIAIGTQTAGSIIRPASFCGVFGFKPSFGSLPVAGLKILAPSLDTVGLFARSADMLRLAWAHLSGRRSPATTSSPPRLAVVRSDDWDGLDADCEAVIAEAATRAAASGAHVTELELPAAFSQLGSRQPVIQAFEAVRSLAWEWHEHRGALSEGLRKIMEWGEAISPDEYDSVLDDNLRARGNTADLFGDVDAFLAPAAVGEAPEGLSNTGDPRPARLWTLLGWPAISVPGLLGSSGLPIGIQLIGRPHRDADLLVHGEWLAKRIG